MIERSGRIIIVDDDPLIRDSLFELLRQEGYSADTAAGPREVLDKFAQSHYDLLIADIKMPEMSGIELLKRVKNKHPDCAVIIITGYGSIQNAVEAMKEGAVDYITKPIQDAEIKVRIENILEKTALRKENKVLRERIRSDEQFHDMVGHDPKMREIYQMVDTIAGTDANVLIYGETGTGKRLIARAIHFHDPSRRDHPFVEVPCAALPETLLESELFGHVKGAFTSALRDRTGRFEMADGGTILLDDIDAFSLGLQAKLLRVLEHQEFERVGDTRTMKVNVRIIAASNRHLEEMAAKGTFREDVYYRLNVVTINVPPLVERKSDVLLLAQYFIARFNKTTGKSKSLAEESKESLLAYRWPGNVRELENAIERACILSKENVMGPADLPDNIRDGVANESPSSAAASLRETIKLPERQIILDTLERTSWNRKEAAKLLGISRSTLYNKMRECGIDYKRR